MRGYKNHGALIETLRVLQEKYHEHQCDVVFTGGVANELPVNLELLARKYDLKDHIHVFGRVDREVLATLYKHAFATVVPSLYEQGSFPIYEALYWGCPVACSDIPSLREQCAAMGEAMKFFDPRDPDSIARAVLDIRDDRSTIRWRQIQSGCRIWKRTWKDVAAEWLPIFREAAELARRQSTLLDTRSIKKTAA
jgi:glycosyltransferase involved in cell wall biosynthesis